MLDVLIVGGGISGLSTAFALTKDANIRCELWESCDRLGGTIGSDRSEGYSIDWGPNGFLDREPLTLKLVDALGLRNVLEPANSKSEKRFIVKNGRLHPVPLSPVKMLTTDLISAREKARVFCEPLIRGRKDDGDESVFDFAARRIGRAAAEMFVDPMVSGVFGGLARELSLPACFPIMREMELRHGGLVKAMISRQLEKRRSRNHKDATSKKSGGPGGPAGRLTSFKTGLDVLTQTMGARLNSVIKLNREVARIDRQENCWSICDKTGNAVRARQVVLACPTYNIAPMFADFDQVLSEAFNSFPYAPIIVMATGHRREDVSHPLDGFGFLIPRNQKLRTLGSIWTSSIFSERAPEGHVQFRSMFGGAGDPAVLELSDEQLWTTLKRELDPLVGIRNDPRFMRIYRWKRGIPQFTLGHRERRARLDRLLEKHPGLFVVGNAYSGVSLNECVKMAYKISEKIASLSIQNWV